MFSEESSEERSAPQREVQVLRVGSSVGAKFLQTRLGPAEAPGASVRLEGTSCQRYAPGPGSQLIQTNMLLSG